MSNASMIDLIKASGFPFELLKNDRRIHSSAEGAAYWKIQIGQTAPALILRTESKFLLLIVSGAVAKVDLKTLATTIDAGSLKMGTSQEINGQFGLKPGDVPLFGLNLPTLIDRHLMTYDFVYGGSGDPDYTLKVSPQALPVLNREHRLVDIPSLMERS
ncbi:MAG: YbaK/EbsC family protein [Thermovirgaceae bacterium]|nr:YbaK/EbsC family protein [Thermovirgaceae bacterium]